MAQEKPGKKVIAQNREARHEYFVIEALETGVELVGTEVKSRFPLQHASPFR